MSSSDANVPGAKAETDENTPLVEATVRPPNPHSAAPAFSPYVYSLDFLRGCLAFGVMSYHILRYEKIINLNVLGYYCVYGFFVLSGMALYLTYAHKILSFGQVKTYLLRRIFRIAPLYWFTCLAVFYFIRVPDNPVYTSLMNASLLFGFFDPGGLSMVTGGWSIGIEFVYYLIFPVLVWLAAGRGWRLAVLSVVTIAISLGFINRTLPADQLNMTSEIWSDYIQPIAFIGYFVTGCALAHFYEKTAKRFKGSAWSFVAVGLLLLPFILIRADGPLPLLMGWRGGLLMMATIGLVWAFSYIPEHNRHFKAAAVWFGRLSYSVYLLHPVIYWSLRKVDTLGTGSRIFLTLFLTLIAARLIYALLESPARNLGRKLA